MRRRIAFLALSAAAVACSDGVTGPCGLLVKPVLVAYARRARKAGRNPQQLAHEHLRAIGAFMATLPAPARAGFDQMLAEELEAAHAAAERRKKR
jgi:hypothetical protein